MRRISIWCGAALLLLLTSTNAFAGSWHRFSDRSLGFTLSYPVGWQAAVTTLPGAGQLVLQGSGKSRYAMTVLALELTPGSTPQATLQELMAHGPTSGGLSLNGIRWSTTTLGGKRALAGVSRPPTEGGVGVSNAVYVVGWKSHVYEVVATSYTQPAPSQLSRFPSVYRQILKTWHFL